ncbi:MAG: hypothetical protein GEV08_04760 [Acidimicrobiia bacterium]|nr:hypothetical protein [Acidimicrobiia bacterium]
MPQVRVTCPSCGAVDVERDTMSAHVTLGSMTCSYRFPCPSCAGLVERPCPPSTVDMLVDCGVSLVVTAPGRGDRASDTPGGSDTPGRSDTTGQATAPAPAAAPLDSSDLARFQALLADDAALAAALEALAGR